MEVAAEAKVSLWHTVKGDLTGSGGLRLVGVIAMLVWMAFQWGWGNDTWLLIYGSIVGISAAVGRLRR